jgi:hypothetical protein
MYALSEKIQMDFRKYQELIKARKMSPSAPAKEWVLKRS